MKKIILLSILLSVFLSPLKLKSQDLNSFFKTTIQKNETLSKIFKPNSKGETAGKITFTNFGDQNAAIKYFVLGKDTVYLDSGSKVKADLNTKKRIHTFYKVTTDNKKVATLVEQQDFITPELKYYIPIPSWIWGTAISNIESPAQYKQDYGNVTMWGFGVGAQAFVYDGVRVFADFNGFTYDQEITPKGGTANHNIGIGGQITFPKGAKYSTYTGSIRLGLKYVFLRDKPYQPWVGVAYGINIWTVKYVTWDADAIYGQASGVTMRSSIMAGIDFKIDKFATLTFFFDAISPVANYTMTNLFGVGDYNQIDGVTYPTPRIGFAIGM
jgi:hypothetical protein